jgi:hypothetical protein
MNGTRSNNGRFARRFVHRPPMALAKNIAQWAGNCRVVLLARDFLFGRAIQTDQMVRRNPAFLRIKFCKLDGFRNRFVVNDDGRIGERLLGARYASQEARRNRGEDKAFRVEN